MVVEGGGGYASGADLPKAPQRPIEKPQQSVTSEVGDDHNGPQFAFERGYRPIPRVKCDGTIDALLEYTQKGEPVIIEGAEVIDPERWKDHDKLSKLLGHVPCLVKRSPCNRFRYFDVSKNTGGFAFKPPLVESKMTFDQFVKEADKDVKDRKSWVYLQETLAGHGDMAKEFASWKWDFVIRASQANKWGLPDSNELFIGVEGVETPLHFDERENLFFQVRGRKDVVLFPFTDYVKVYPFPTTHPCDRQSMVNVPDPDYRAFPRFRDAQGWWGRIDTGDLLYLPYGWWHWLKNVDHLAISVSFWCTTPPNDFSHGIPTYFSEHMLTRVRRNLESMVSQKCTGNPKQLDDLMVGLAKTIREGGNSLPLMECKSLLNAVKIPPEKQNDFLLEIIDGRYGIDWNKYVI